MPELSFVPEYGVVPSRTQFEEAVARLEWHLETADLAAFDPRHAWKMSDPVSKAYGNRPYARKMSSYGFTYVHPDGAPVTLEEQAQALHHVFRHNPEDRYAPAAAWRRC